MGPVCQYDPLTVQLLDALSRRPGPPNHWCQCWLSLCLGLGYAAAEKDAQATSEITQSLLAGGTFEHPLTAMGLLELGKLAFKKGENDTAATMFMEATYSAVLYEQNDVLEEAFKWAHASWIVSGKSGPMPPLANAIEYSRQKGLRSLNTTLLILAAEGSLDVGDSASATQLLGKAKQAMLQSDLLGADVGSRYNYTAAWLAFQTGKLDAGSASLSDAMKWQTVGSKRLFQIGLVDVAAAASQVTTRVAELLYANTLREPTARDWIVDPQDTLAVISTPHPLPYEHWFDICLLQKETGKAIEVADRLRRHRFFTTISMGGRLEALRWVLAAPSELLPNEAKLQRQALLLKFPAYDHAAQKVKELHDQLEKLPAESPDRTKLLAEQNKFIQMQELILREICVRREPSEFVFPPITPTSDLQKKLPEKTLMLVYLFTSRQVHAFAVTSKQIGHWVIDKPEAVRSDLQAMYQSWGLYERLHQVTTNDLAAETWRTPADRITTALTNTQPADWDKYDELVVVPDKFVWHVPFETLPAGTGSKEPLIARARVRCVPYASLAIPDQRLSPRTPKTVLVLGRPASRDPKELAERAANDSMPPGLVVEKWNESLPGPSSLSRQLCDRLLVMGDVEDSEKGPYAWAPLVIDRNKPGSQLVDWFALPWDGPLEVAFPQFHTAAEYSLKKGGTGDEIFLAVSGLMASGSRTVLLGRWKMGGVSTIDLMREYHQELGHTSAAQAWRRSVRLLQENDYHVDLEPRLKPSRDAVSGKHPIFWAGYLLCDTGSDPEELEK
jgi:hypothetical protein